MAKKFLALLLVIPLLAFVMSGCQSDKEGKHDKTLVDQSADPVDGDLKPLKKQTTVVVAEDGSASGAGFYIAKEKGYFKDYNIKIKFATFSNSDDMLPALASGKVDVAGGISSASFFNSIAQGIDVKMIADKGHNIKGHSYFSFVIRKDLQDKIKSYKDLTGKRIAVSTKNGVDDYIFSQMLKSAGLTRKDVDFVLMSDFGNMLSAMGNKQIDAALQIEPLITKGTAKGIHVRFGDATDFAPKAQIAMVLGSPQFVGKNRDVALRFMVAYLKGLRDYNDVFVKGTGDKDGIINIMTKYTPLKDPKIWEKVDVAGLDPNGKMFVDDIKKQYEWYKSRGGISGDVDMKKAVDTSLAKEAVKILGEYK
ncbi:NitT/TauT family transport system substrate-binding protein [Scopulibacillus darangshiensis]|uniref:NitT/TauT family transport system substrate-binding protein n=1 Tax=Scopulibacillus darangshiensis TaxID=442528 RepID=A0A4V2SLS1_9BACL|nr:ABC transporter substrate-binding protein [Scopulibacillus darangshiensis]TCP24536.1 NitT/TauT family transport system substrate-binding protein [Scopulibacillus darangshiensis]